MWYAPLHISLVHPEVDLPKGSNAVMASIIARNPDLLPSRDLSLRHHTEAQIAAKKAKAAATRDVEELETREPHHTEAQIAAKNAKTSARDFGAGKNCGTAIFRYTS